MPKAKVGILRTSPATVFRDYHSVMNLAGYQEILDKTADTALKINIAFRINMFLSCKKSTAENTEGPTATAPLDYGEVTRCVPHGTTCLGGPPARCLVRTGPTCRGGATTQLKHTSYQEECCISQATLTRKLIKH